MGCVGQRLLLSGLQGDAELDGLGVFFLEGVGRLADFPIRPAVEMLDDADLDGLVLITRLRAELQSPRPHSGAEQPMRTRERRSDANRQEFS